MTRARALSSRRVGGAEDVRDEAASQLGDAASQLGDAASQLGDAASQLGDAACDWDHRSPLALSPSQDYVGCAPPRGGNPLRGEGKLRGVHVPRSRGMPGINATRV